MRLESGNDQEVMQESNNDLDFQCEKTSQIGETFHIGETFQIRETLSFTDIRVQITKIGTDYNLLIGGGESPHIGCTVLTVPRLSLTGDGTVSCTSSVINVTGHKDEIICRRLAEKVSSRKRAVVVCTGGVHMEHIRPEQIKEIEGSVERLADKITERM